jgi:hypothetical protein
MQLVAHTFQVPFFLVKEIHGVQNRACRAVASLLMRFDGEHPDQVAKTMDNNNN